MRYQEIDLIENKDLLYDLESLRSFKHDKTALLDPTGKLISVSLYGHFEELQKYPEFKDDIESFDTYISDAEDDFQRSIDPGEHPAWHSFESWKFTEQEEFRRDILSKAYDLGWARIGIVPSKSILELETSGKNVSKLRRIAKEIAEMISTPKKDYTVLVTNVDKFKE